MQSSGVMAQLFLSLGRWMNRLEYGFAWVSLLSPMQNTCATRFTEKFCLSWTMFTVSFKREARSRVFWAACRQRLATTNAYDRNRGG